MSAFIGAENIRIKDAIGVQAMSVVNAAKISSGNYRAVSLKMNLQNGQQASPRQDSILGTR